MLVRRFFWFVPGLLALAFVVVPGEPAKAGEALASVDARKLSVSQREARTANLKKLQGVLSLFDQSLLFNRFVADLERTVRRGDIELAERQINEAGDLAMLAAIFTDYIRDPDFSQTLQKLRIEGDDSIEEGRIGEKGSSEPSSAMDGSGINRNSELEEALETEKRRNQSQDRELSAALEEQRRLQSYAEQVSHAASVAAAACRDDLHQEQERAKWAHQSLDSVRTALSNLETRFQSEREAARMRIQELETAIAEGQSRFEVMLRDYTVRRSPTDLLKSPPVQESGQQGADTIVTGEVHARSVLDVPSIAVMDRSLFQWESVVGITRDITGSFPSVTSLPAGPSAATALPSAHAVRSSASPSALDDRLLTRARSLLDASDISGARLLLERLADAGHPQGIFMLAESLDPNILLERGVRGIQGDRQRAVELYARSLKLGVDQSMSRLKALE